MGIVVVDVSVDAAPRLEGEDQPWAEGAVSTGIEAKLIDPGWV